jgi:hypothetical protein
MHPIVLWTKEYLSRKLNYVAEISTVICVPLGIVTEVEK